MPQPEEPGIAVSADYFGPFPVTPRGSTYILLFTDRFGRRAEMYAVTAAELQLAFASTGIFTSGDARTAYSWTTASSLAQSFRMPSTSFLGFGKSPPAATTQKGNGGMDHFDHTMAQMLDMVVIELQNNWNEQLPHIEFAYKISASAATSLAPNEVHMGRLPRLPLTIFERTGVAGHQSLAHDHLVYCDLATDRSQRAYDFVREHHALTVSRMERRNSALSDVLCAVSKFAVGGLVWVYNTAATIHQGTKTDTDAKVPKGQAIAQLDGALQSRRSWALFLR